MSPLVLTFLFICGSLTAIISAVSGMGGGIVLLSILTLFLDISVIVPIHGVVQLISNSTRTWLLRDNVIRKIFLWFCAGVPIGTLISIKIIKTIQNKDIFLIFIAVLIFYSVFKPKRLPEIKLPYWCFSFVGVCVGILGPLIGATGPFIAPFFIRSDFTKEQIVATKSSVQVVGHLVKLPTFFYLGFNYLEHVNLIAVLTVGALLGTHLGVKILGKIQEKSFRYIFKGALLFAGLRILYKVLM
ncbi:hypothetical protein A9Q84_13530 [Halobacteriovorax marinus]|uniref:Probable membrane transporter protein n=1 Tax=Halobacteriovorax marinus TaxID=97084 RepID=A0A1Y5FEL5_9BACT|nr:hypothetical protein A9Q84_13530 [Halobacteriovorax marinus]